MRLGAVLGLALLVLGCAVADNAVDRTTMQLDGARLVLNGEITSRTPAHFIAALNANPQVQVIVPFDMAGSTDEEAVYRMGDAIRNRGLDTHLTAESEIYSGAVNLFLAGNRRTIEPGAILGVHSWADGFGEGSNYPRDAGEHAGNVAYTRAMLGSDAFYWFTLQAAPSDGIHVLTQAEITGFGLVTE
ncbi:hypothetical protein HKX54_03080 [Sulfitobacter sp. M57]|nr:MULTISPECIES: hypothetical protein [unclassified Sulfitobacter]MDF3461517.1 hypothetical protein [Sulfitobacter sp. Ks18]MDF3469313.1 hypothetical protein [Sulfitobacter sp. M28]MDF3476964.1 hypothetical protein [Sulfitobacter sp. M53]MDF3480862.1 hypothetical protein [Sulfitobacter sp. M24]MDF3492562.1 hypothetical protein [Sulfitobacter sp. M51]MDF3504276.1 hypothetical protein [Sulfitobacter sp. M54]MDF3508175.1 hypothetical protein [Sulfitobacter sp. M57]MDF3512072.1 hypothetical pro